MTAMCDTTWQETAIDEVAAAVVDHLPHTYACIAHHGPCRCSTRRAARALVIAVVLLPVIERLTDRAAHTRCPKDRP